MFLEKFWFDYKVPIKRNTPNFNPKSYLTTKNNRTKFQTPLPVPNLSIYANHSKETLPIVTLNQTSQPITIEQN